MLNKVCSQSSLLLQSGNCNTSKDGDRKHAESRPLIEQCSPFHCLPHEIIAKIFVLCLPDFEGNFISKRAAPLLLCNVSSSWRSFALSIPRLWNQLSIKVEDPQGNIDIAVAMAESWIARSEERTFYGQGALTHFFNYSSRWELVDIDLAGVDKSISFPEFDPTPLLRGFSTSCPLLSSFAWPFSCSPTSNPNIPWPQLMNITVGKMGGGTVSTHQALDILQTCEMLVEFNVVIIEYSDNAQSHQVSVEHRSLRTFHICMHQSGPGLFQSLTLPALTDISLVAPPDDYDSIESRPMLAELLGLFTRSKCKLEQFELENSEFDDDGILECFKHDSCSSLTALRISNFHDTPILTDKKVDVSEVKNGLLPHLSSLWFDKCVSASPGMLGSMVATRYLGGNQLKSFTLLARNLDDRDVALLKTAEKMGLDTDSYRRT